MVFPPRPPAASAINATGVSCVNTRNGTQSSPTHSISAKDRKMIQSIKDIVGNGFSDTDIYLVLKESNMDPNESAHKLLNQDPFHEVKRRNHRRKENISYRNTEVNKKVTENIVENIKAPTVPDRSVKYSGSNTRLPFLVNRGRNKEFRVVRDNRVNQGSTKEVNSHPFEVPKNDLPNRFVGDKISVKQPAGNMHPLQSNKAKNSFIKHGNRHQESASDPKISFEERRISRLPTSNPSEMQMHHPLSTSSSVGVYSSTDPVHVPSPESRPSAAVGAIKREVGVVGGRRLSMENAVKDPLSTADSFSNSLSEPFRPFSLSKSDKNVHAKDREVVSSDISVSRPSSNHQSNGKFHQAISHQKAHQLNKEWKPKVSQKPSAVAPGVIGTPQKSIARQLDSVANSHHVEVDHPGANIEETQNVVIAQHLRVSETEKVRLTFGSFGVEIDNSSKFSSKFQENGIAEELNVKSVLSSSVSVPEDFCGNASPTKQGDLSDDQTRISASNSSDLDNQLPDKSSCSENLDNYHDIGLVEGNDHSYHHSESQHQQESGELPNYSVYDPQNSYELSYFRSSMDRNLQPQGLSSTQEVLSNHPSSNMPMSTISMVQQQQPPMTQMYPQVHLSHFANMVPYRQFLSPVYVPQIAMPGYSSNPAYPHPSNGNSYVLMPGNSSHISANGIKYGIQQFKPVPGGSPTGYGNYSNPAGYTLSTPSGVASAVSVDDSSRIKYKDGSLYVPNPQAETSEIWVQNPREVPSLQSSAYYNMAGQTPQAAYLPSHGAHASFNAAAQSSHMPFSGLYPPQPSNIANPHHLGHVGVGVTPNPPTPQVGTFQQPQIGHINWATTF